VNARAVAAWSAASLVAVLSTTNPAYRAGVLVATLVVVVASAGARARPLLVAAGFAALTATVFSFLVSHAGADHILDVPDAIPVIGGSYTVEAVVFGLVSGITLAAVLLAVAPISLLLEPHEVVDALPRTLGGSGSAVAAALNLAPTIAGSFTAVTEAQRLRGWRPRGPISWAEIVVPVVLTAIEDSIQLAESMEARAYGSGRRTHLRRLPLARADWLVVGVCATSVAALVALRAAGLVADWYPYPFLQAPEVSPLPLAACLLLALPALPWRSRRSAP